MAKDGLQGRAARGFKRLRRIYYLHRSFGPLIVDL
jgi:hypothetical protein